MSTIKTTLTELKTDKGIVIKTGQPHVLEISRIVANVQMVGMFFDTNKNFLLPSAMRGIRKMVDIYCKYPSADLLVIGHTDTTGQDKYNEILSFERAEAVIAYLKDDVEAWYRRYSRSVAPQKRWDKGEDLAMLSALPDHELHENERDPIKSYQKSRGLKVDGIAGPDTRRQLIKDYMALDGTSLPETVEVTAHGCGEYFPIEKTGDNVANSRNRRVEMLFFESGIAPPPPGPISKRGSTEYDTWIEQVTELHRVDVDIQLGDYLMITDVTIAELEDDPEYNPIFKLIACHGEEHILSLRDDRQENDGFADLLFSDLSIQGVYTLKLEDSHNDIFTTIFDSVPYSQLSALSDNLGDNLSVPTDGESLEEEVNEENKVI